MSQRQRRARLALVADRPYSANDRLARSITLSLAAQFDFEILYLSDYERAGSAVLGRATPAELFHELFCGAYQLVHTFEPSLPERVFDAAIAAESGLRDPEGVVDRVFRLPLTTTICDRDLLDGPEQARRAGKMLGVVSAGYVVSSASLRHAIASLPNFPFPAHVIAGADAAAWACFFSATLDAAEARRGALSETNVWERSKAWSARVERVLTRSATA